MRAAILSVCISFSTPGKMSHYDKALKDAEDNLNSKANQMGRLKVEYDHNLQKLTDSYYPKMQPLRNTVYLSQSLQKWIELEIDWKSKMLAKMDMHGPDFSENLHMTDERAAIMATVQPKFDDSIKSLEALTPDDMKVSVQGLASDWYWGHGGQLPVGLDPPSPPTSHPLLTPKTYANGNRRQQQFCLWTCKAASSKGWRTRESRCLPRSAPSILQANRRGVSRGSQRG